MKPYLFLSAMLMLLVGCDVSETSTTQIAGSATTNPRTIAIKGGCMGCHAISNSVYGPAWKLVSKRYQGLPDARATLIENIKNGSYGRWMKITRGKRMPPQEGALSDEEFGIIVDFILTLETK